MRTSCERIGSRRIAVVRGKMDRTMLASINAYGLIVAAMVIALSIIAADKAAELRKSDPK